MAPWYQGNFLSPTFAYVNPDKDRAIHLLLDHDPSVTNTFQTWAL